MNPIRSQHASSPIRPLPPIAGQLDNEAVLVDLRIEASLWNMSAVAISKALVPYITTRHDGSHTVPLYPEANTVETVYAGRSGVCCSCCEWRSHHLITHDYPMADPNWLCRHGAAVLLKLGRSQTYTDWQSVQSLNRCDILNTSEVESDTPDDGLNRRAFFACLGKRHAFKLATVGLDHDTVMEAYRRRFDVISLSELDERQWAIAGAEMQAAIEDKALLKARAAELKALWADRATPKGGQAA